MKTYTLTEAEALLYDSDDARDIERFSRLMREQFGQIAGGGPVETEVRHPDGFVVEHYTNAPNPRDVAERVAAIVGDDGSGDIGVIVRQALKDDPSSTDEDIIEIIREARKEARG